MKYSATIMKLATVGVLAASLQGCFPLVAAGVGTGVIATVDRRTYGAQVDDTNIEIKITASINEKLGDKAHVSVTSFNRWVLLTGQVWDEASKAEAERIAGQQPNVRKVFNEITVSPARSLGSQSNDAYLTTKVKARLIDAPGFSAQQIKVVTEDSVVYLMGLVTAKEAELTTNVVSTTSGVRKVVQVFEVISDEEARRLTIQPAQDQSAPAAR